MYAVYIFGGILALLLAAVIFAPMVERKSVREAEAPTPEGRKARALDALRELEFEYETGKMAESDYRQLRAHWAAEAIEARDALGEASGPTGSAAECPVCAATVKPGARFCSRCGESLADAASAS
ncbi:MAG: zinc ribbon domain-containing protein [Gemmatimonadota bacterium]